jgi:hypothetical protein
VRTASIEVLPGGVRQPTRFLTAQQVYTIEVFQHCNGYGAVLTTVKPDGGFSFELEGPPSLTTDLARCMARYGFTFTSIAIGESTNFGPQR